MHADQRHEIPLEEHAAEELYLNVTLFGWDSSGIAEFLIDVTQAIA